MASINFIDTVTHLPSHWANAVDALVYDVFSGAATQTQARAALGIGTLALQNASAANITGGVINNVNIGQVTPCTGNFSILQVQNDPINILDVANKKYVDNTFLAVQPIITQALLHFGDNNIHVTSAQKTMLNGLIVGSVEINMLQGVSGNVQSQIDSLVALQPLYVEVAGDVMSGDLHIQKTSPVFCLKNTIAGTVQCLTLRVDGGTEYFYVGYNGGPPNATDPVTLIGAYATRVVIGGYTEDDGVTDFQIHRDTLLDGNLTFTAAKTIDLVSSSRIVNSPNPVNPFDVATKDYVDTVSYLGPAAAPVQDAMDLVNVPQAQTADKQMRLAENQGSIYRYDAQAIDPPVGTDVIQPAFGIGRWFKMSTSIPSHNGLTGLQGGVSGEMFHFDNAEHTYLSTLVSQAVPVGYFSGITSNIQTQLDGKLDTGDFGAASAGDYLFFNGTNWIANSVIQNVGGGTIIIDPVEFIVKQGSNKIYLDSTSQLRLDCDGAIPFRLNAAGSERLRISSTGAWGLGGANFGNLGQVMTSNGVGSPPTWQNAGTATLAYEHVQAVAATSWVLSHGYGTEKHVISIYDSTGNAMIPQNVQITDANTLNITFSSAQAGRAFVVFF
jgi:hypothetical protein